MKKNKVIDYMTVQDAVKALDYAEASHSVLTRMANDGRIEGAFKFGSSWALPTAWVRQQAGERGIYFNGIELKENEVPVSLQDYEHIKTWSEKKGDSSVKISTRIRRNQGEYDYVRFGNMIGIRKDS